MMDGLLIAKDLMRDHGFPVFHPDDSLAEVMRQLTGHVHEAPVLRDGEIVGSIWPDDVISRYNSEVFKRDTAVGLASSMERGKITAEIPGISNMKLAEIQVPNRFVGKSIGELNVRKRYGISILMLKRKVEGREGLVDTIPSAETVLSYDDIVLAMGTSEDLDRFEKGSRK
jgi:K+/H+ antiporter YhaU regulatory subunit KhtT